MSLNLGFLTILHEASGYLGGYLVTNAWGRPLEFRLSTAVQPNRVQQILYGDTLQPYICSDLIGKTLVEKTGTLVQALFTDREPALDLRRSVDFPVAWVSSGSESSATLSSAAVAEVRPATSSTGPIFHHPGFPGDGPKLHGVLGQLPDAVDFAEPFVRIREAIGEARRMGVTGRG
jgi:hypothetical protein